MENIILEEGMKKTKGKYEVVVDRTEAIKAAIKMANKREFVLKKKYLQKIINELGYDCRK